MDTSSFPQETSYNLQWAANTFKSFIEKYGRAADILREIFDYDPLFPIVCLASDQKRWERYKKQVKWVDTYMKKEYCGRQYPRYDKVPLRMLSKMKTELEARYLFGRILLDKPVDLDES